jgi:hypothetical protein
MPYRHLVLLFCGMLALFVGANYLVWKLRTEELLTDNRGDGGDLARMGYISGVKMPRRNAVDLPQRHLEGHEYRGGPIDLVTIGDSYSHGGGGGRNRYYQDYIATLHNLRVVNLPALKLPGEDDEITQLATVVKLANSGWLHERGVKYVLLQSAEWRCIERFARAFDFSLSDDPARLSAFYATNHKKYELPVTGFLNNGNLKWLVQPISYRLFGRDFNKKVYLAELDRDLFSVKDGRTLLFYRDNVKSTPKFTLHDVQSLNNNLNSLADLLEQQGVQLLFMPCVDKFNLYTDYIVGNRHPRSTFFENLRPLPKRYRFVDTKAILAEGLRKGVKDIYYADDTHWSWKASEIIVASKEFKFVTQ